MESGGDQENPNGMGIRASNARMSINEEGIRAKSSIDGNNAMHASKLRSGSEGSRFAHLEDMETDGGGD